MNPLPATDGAPAIRQYHIPDISDNSNFDHFLRLAALFLEVPVVLLTIPDGYNTIIKTGYGLETHRIESDYGLSAAAIRSNGLFVISNARMDVRTSKNPLVTGSFGMQFYAAIPLTLKDGNTIGILSVMDNWPREPDDKQREFLKSLASILTDNIEERYAAQTAIDHKNNALKIIAHDLKNPLSSINLLADLIQTEKDNEHIIDMLSSQIKGASIKMKERINQLSEIAGKESAN